MRTVLATLFFVAVAGGSYGPLMAACNGDSDCAPGEICIGGICEKVCIPSCEGKECGPNGCGDVCGKCPPGVACLDSGKCDCVPQCDGKICGPNGCGGYCGNGSGSTQGCPPGMECDLEKFKCVEPCKPVCKGLECGDDGCGGSCGECQAGMECVEGKCELSCQDECEPGGKGCEEGKPWACMKDQDGCTIRAYSDCKADEVCAEGLCVPARVPVDGQDDEVTEVEDAAADDAEVPEEDIVPTGQDVRGGSDVPGRTEEVRSAPDDAEPLPRADATPSADTTGTVPKDKEKKSGCQAGPFAGAGWAVLVAGILLLVAWRRRQAA
ncbi:MAG: hypothetical protein FJ109_15240 [Deltaproteobacteria bacterium]|nr:hypothetical protein [Deltaproteobacteria bacterium]